MRKHPFIHLCATAALLLALSACASPNTNQVPSAGGNLTDTSTTDDAAQKTGIMSQFTATDLDGNTIDQSILADYKLTLVNVWGTFCRPCINEMPDLGELSKEYADKGVRIVGLVADALAYDGSVSDEQIETAKKIVEKTGADYLHIVPSEDLFGILSSVTAVPTTFFVDSEGNQVGYAILSAQSKDTWIKMIDEALAEVEE